MTAPFPSRPHSFYFRRAQTPTHITTDIAYVHVSTAVQHCHLPRILLQTRPLAIQRSKTPIRPIPTARRGRILLRYESDGDAVVGHNMWRHLCCGHQIERAASPEEQRETAVNSGPKIIKHPHSQRYCPSRDVRVRLLHGAQVT